MSRILSAALALALTACLLTACGAHSANVKEPTPAATAAKGEKSASVVPAPEDTPDDASQDALSTRGMIVKPAK